MRLIVLNKRLKVASNARRSQTRLKLRNLAEIFLNCKPRVLLLSQQVKPRQKPSLVLKHPELKARLQYSKRS